MRRVAIVGALVVGVVAAWWLVAGSDTDGPGAAAPRQVSGSGAQKPGDVSRPAGSPSEPVAGTSRAPTDDPSTRRLHALAERRPAVDPHPDLSGFEDAPGSDVDPEALAEAKSRVASYAVSQGLVNPGLLAQKAQQAVPSGSVPSALLDQARQDYQQRAMGDAALAAFLTAQNLPRDAPESERNRLRGWAETFVSAMNEPDRNAQIQRMDEQLASEPPPSSAQTSSGSSSSGGGMMR